jgi:hypothetical protein
MMKIKFGGSGDVTTKKLENAIELIIRARTGHTPITVDSNFVICLIREVIKVRTKPYLHVSEFSLDDDSLGDEIVGSLDDEDEDDSEAVELRRPIPLKRKSQSQIHKVRVSSKKYWLDSWGSRLIAGILLLALIAIPVIFTFV